MSKNCNKCGKELLPGNNFCVNCEGKTNWSGYFFIVALAIIVAVIGMNMMKAQPPTTPTVKQVDFSHPTNPTYLGSPSNFIVDKDNDISLFPKDDQPVWVERIIDGNTVVVSQIISEGGNQIVIFGYVGIFGLSGLAGCQNEEATKFLRRFIEHKYVYLSGRYINLAATEVGGRTVRDTPGTPKKHLLKNVEIEKASVDISIINEEYKNTPSKMIEINTAMIYAGYASYYKYDSHIEQGSSIYTFEEQTDLRRRYNMMEEVAKVAKRGFWDGKCDSVQ